mmetsp:Transcript_25664/g.67127  ORF Transcript_25664/g.67127 Transcript_25664/m.67127 type:complete len:122 (+) Transcript_25664:1575-1940(+)
MVALTQENASSSLASEANDSVSLAVSRVTLPPRPPDRCDRSVKRVPSQSGLAEEVVGLAVWLVFHPMALSLPQLARLPASDDIVVPVDLFQLSWRLSFQFCDWDASPGFSVESTSERHGER